MEITCTACNKLYKNAKTYKAHIKMNKCKIYDNSLECKICNKIFSNKYNPIYICTAVAWLFLLFLVLEQSTHGEYGK